MKQSDPKATLRLGLVQMTSADNHADNIAFAQEIAAQAAGQGVEFLAFPEMAGMMNERIENVREQILDAHQDPWILACRDLARNHGMWVHCGSTPVVTTGDSRFHNHAAVIDAQGRVVAGYDKVHLFDIYPEEGTPILESKRYMPGQYAVMPRTPWGPAGLAICYDLRFSHFFVDYARDGATMLFIPAAFTVPTGRAHWEVLLRARAIETGCFVIAAAQTGTHGDGRETWGHGMVVDPWGKVLTDMGDAPGLAVIDLDMSAVRRARAQIPNLANARSYSRRTLPDLD